MGVKMLQVIINKEIQQIAGGTECRCFNNQLGLLANFELFLPVTAAGTGGRYECFRVCCQEPIKAVWYCVLEGGVGQQPSRCDEKIHWAV
jgi:hypothetical protein